MPDMKTLTIDGVTYDIVDPTARAAIYVGNTEPTDDRAKVWINPDGIPSSGNTSDGTGTPGAPGKSAYEYAKEAGYDGTEQEFAADLAKDTYSKSEIDAALGSYITDIDTLIGGEG